MQQTTNPSFADVPPDAAVLHAALEAMQESVVLCDADDRIVYCNRQFRALNHALADAACAGAPYGDYLKSAIERGLVTPAREDAQAWLAGVLTRRREEEQWEHEVQRSDGRWLLQRFARLPAGGSMTTESDITLHKQAGQALAESEERFHDVTQASGDWFWETDAAHRYLWISESIGRHVGRPASHYIGRDRFDVAAAAGEKVDAEPWVSHRQVLARHEAFRDFRTVRRTPLGDVWLSVSGVPRFDAAGRFIGYRAVVKNVSTEVENEQRARAADALLRAAIENLAEAIAVTDAEDRIVLTNRRFRDLNGRTGLIDVGRRYEEHLRAGIPMGSYPDAAAHAEDWLAERMERHRNGGTFEVLRQDGVWLKVTDQPLPDGGTISFALDITEQKAREALLQNVNAELERRVADRTAELEATNRELESFSYSVSHDLRAPLRAINGFANILLEEEGARLSDEGRRLLGIVDANARRMGRLIDSLLALGRLSRDALQLASIDMTRLAGDVRAELAPAHRAARIEVAPLPPVLGDATLLRQLMVNLVANALKYSARSDAPLVEVFHEHGAYVVRDNGVGFDPVYADRLFLPFERLHAGAEFEGTGVGLAIVKLIVERHGGAIEAHSGPGQGAIFRFTLPSAR